MREFEKGADSRLINDVSLFIAKSTTPSSQINKTGSWRYVRPVYQDSSAPCIEACPLAIHIPKVELLLSRGRTREAWETVMMENPLPSVCGRVCFFNCERACNRKEFDLPVSINNLERFIGDIALKEGYVLTRHAPSNGKNVAVIGSGPAGLSAAYFLTCLGFNCEIFEKEGEAGGLLRWGIPSYRLPKEILRREIQRIVDMGVTIHLNAAVTQTEMVGMGESFDAVFAAVGLAKPIRLGIEGEERLLDGIAFLRAPLSSTTPRFSGERVAVIGGGNTAIDVARSLLRIKAKPVIIYRRREVDMPAFGHEIEMAKREGIKIMELRSPLSITQKGEEVEARLQKMRVDNTDSHGRASVVPLENETERLTFFAIYSGVGSTVEEGWGFPTEEIERLRLSHCELSVMDKTPLFFGGDLINKVNSVSDAIASGKQAAMALNLYYKHGSAQVLEKIRQCGVGEGDSLSFEVFAAGPRQRVSRDVVSFEALNMAYFERMDRVSPAILEAEERARHFDEIEGGFSLEEARREAGRCFNCGTCDDCGNCGIFCPEASVILEEDRRRIDLDFCKGCGVCVTECPRHALILVEEV